MNIRRNFLVEILLMIIQLFHIKVKGQYNGSQYSQNNFKNITLPLTFNSSNSNKTLLDSSPHSIMETNNLKAINSTDLLNQKIRSLAARILNFVESIQNYPDSKENNRSRRSNSPPGFSLNLENPVQMIQAEIADMKKEIAKMKLSTSINNKTTNTLDGLVSAMDVLRQSFDNKVREITAQIKALDLENLVKTFNVTISQVRKEVDSIKQIVQEEYTESLQTKIIHDIKSRDFENATKKLSNLNGELDKHINYIVHEVYNGQAGNFYLILLFGNNRGMNATTSLTVYQALYAEMEDNYHIDYLKILKLFKNLDRKLSNKLSEAEDFKKTLLDKVKEKVVDELIKAETSKNYYNFSQILETIYMEHLNAFNFVIKRALNDIILDIDVENLINFFIIHNDAAAQNIWLYSALFHELQKRNSLDQKAVVTLAFALKEALDNSVVDKESRDEGEKVRKALPESVANLAFADRVCIKNIYEMEYLYAAGNEFKLSKFKRRVFSWVPGTRNRLSNWLIERSGNVFHIKNEISGEYMYSYYAADAEGRNVLTWVPKNYDTKQFNWVFEPRGNEVYIKNTRYNEYLFVSEKKYDHNRRYIFTKPSKDNAKISGNNEDSLWLIKNCNANIYNSNNELCEAPNSQVILTTEGLDCIQKPILDHVQNVSANNK